MKQEAGIAGLIVVLLAAMSASAVAQPQVQSPEQLEANDAWNKRAWSTVAEAYRALLKSDSTSAQSHFRLGAALVALGKPADAIPHIRNAERLGTPVFQSAFQLAIAHAASNNDSAFAQLKRATEAGMSVITPLNDSTELFARIKKDSRFAAFERDMDRNARPCIYDERHSQFDFWLGTWDVRPRGQPNAPPATNVITKANEGCVVHESWRAPGSEGQSINIFDRTREKWFQFWVDRSGGLHEYSGVYGDGAMRYEGDMPGPRGSGARIRTRLTFFRIAADTVRQLSESTQDGVAWRVNYDLMYTRRR